mmetsp:Transcript_46395/g.110509  ORF Transcript_46395/g.110509 Transcript_46395/m.110509 type:complete len:255 (+) Transcript_46395:150-914(+)|eukprot:CAMPEP_0178427072 /NCGR_PEP_ID=MMETSP0689_2-20121128/29556_1 /TAXON_ID=160604 /ORGANISM="Amphidinium massartii, Strain CS-259" /LENGTH=254 /DNA_ID=CAMNT_0020048767 /DNA_START=104 /DNA_END=868 /DNA_ORIENTATION=-
MCSGAALQLARELWYNEIESAQEARRLTPEGLRSGPVRRAALLILRPLDGVDGAITWAATKGSLKPARCICPVGVALPRKVAEPIIKLLLRSGRSAVFGVERPEGWKYVTVGWHTSVPRGATAGFSRPLLWPKEPCLRSDGLALAPSGGFPAGRPANCIAPILSSSTKALGLLPVGVPQELAVDGRGTCTPPTEQVGVATAAALPRNDAVPSSRLLVRSGLSPVLGVAIGPDAQPVLMPPSTSQTKLPGRDFLG